jgi:hypothetical protein
MARSFTRVTLFVPGSAGDLETWNARLDGFSIDAQGRLAPTAKKAKLPRVDVEFVENDGAFGKAFSFGTVAPDEVARLDSAPGALVLSAHVDLLEGRAALVEVVRALSDAGALAVRLEQSKLGFGVGRWLELFGADDAWAWHRGAVAFLSSDGALQSCGMHAFSRPDVRAPLDGPAPVLQRLGEVLNVYQLEEDPPLLSGHTFSPDAETPRRRLERWPDFEYPEGHPCHNPYGVWRLGAPGSRARTTVASVSFMPTLRALLEAARDGGAALTKKQVERLRDEAVVMAVDPAHLAALERARGYADLDPELVWEQWAALERARRHR